MDVRSIERGAQDANDSEHVAPLPVGRVTTQPKPLELLEQNVFWRMYVNHPAAQIHRTTPLQLPRIERRPPSDKDVDFALRLVMNEVCAPPLDNRPEQRLGIDVKLPFESRHPSRDLVCECPTSSPKIVGSLETMTPAPAARILLGNFSPKGTHEPRRCTRE